MAKRNLLLIDADPRSLRVLEVSLRKAGFSVTTAGDVDSALELVSLSEPDMIIADTRLPGKDGFALVAELRARPTGGQIPLMFLSSDPAVESKMRGLELGVEDYLTKPVYIREVLARVNLVMDRKEREGLGRTAKTRFSGSLEDMGLIDLLQTIEVSRKSGVLKLSSGPSRGAVFFQEGRVIDAELGKLQGEAAIYRFLLWNEGSFELEFRQVQRSDRLGISTQALLMEGVRRVDEWGRLQEQLPGMHAVLEVNHGELVQRLAEIPDELNDVLRAFDGQHDIAQVVESLAGDDLATLTAVSRLYFEGFLTVLHRSDLSGDAQVGTHASDPFVGYIPSPSFPPPADGAPEEPVSTTAVTRVSAIPAQLSDELPPEASRVSAPAKRPSVTEPSSSAQAKVAIGVVQLKRVSAINDTTTLRPQPFAVEVPPESAAIANDHRQESPRLNPAAEGDDDMSKRGKRKAERAEERAVGNVIPLHLGRGDSAVPQEVMSPLEEAPEEDDEREDSGPQAARSAEQLAIRSEPEPQPASGTTEEAPEVREFFASAPKSGEWNDLEPADPDPTGQHRERRGKRWTLAIALAGMALIGGFLFYNKVFMPTPEELSETPVPLPEPAAQPLAPSAPPTQPAPAAREPLASPVSSAQPAVEEPKPTTEPLVQPTPAPSAAAVTPSPEYTRLVSEARKLGIKRGAEQLYQKALALDPKGAEALSGLAMLYLNQGKTALARARAEQAIASDERNDEAWIVLGAAQSALGKTREARDAYVRCAALTAGKYVPECKRMLRL